MINNKFVTLAVLGSLVLAMPVFAKTDTPKSTELNDNWGGMMGRGEMMRPKVVGTVASINGTTLTVTSNKVGWGRESQDQDEDNQDKNTPAITPTPVTYTIDASKATVIKAGVASTVAGIAIGDMVMIQGTITGTNIVATTIRDGVIKPTKTPKPEPTPLIQGNGQPIIAGVISAINGTTLTITNQSNVTYTVNASTAKVQIKNALSTLSSVAVGDNVVIQGAVNGTAVTAYSVIDQGATPSVSPTGKPEAHGNFFGGVGQFFKHLFGF